MTKGEVRRQRRVDYKRPSVVVDHDSLMRGVHKEAGRLVILPGARLVWSDEENRMVWRKPKQ